MRESQEGSVMSDEGMYVRCVIPIWGRECQVFVVKDLRRRDGIERPAVV